MELVNDRANQACGRTIGRAPQRVPDLNRQSAMLQQQRHQDRSISRKRIQRRVLLGSVEEHFAQSAIREIAHVHPVTVTGVLDVERDCTAAMWQTLSSGGRHDEEPSSVSWRASTHRSERERSKYFQQVPQCVRVRGVGAGRALEYDEKASSGGGCRR
jgi:hypothetical protein